MSAKLPPWLPTNNWVRALFAPALVFIATSVNHNYQTDFWHHLARGQAMWERGELVNTDLFSFTVAGKSFQDANWLSQIAFYVLFRLGGLDMVQVANSLVLAAVMGMLVWMVWRKSDSMMVAGGLGVFAFLGLWQLLIIRPQTFSLLLFVLLYAAMEGAGRDRRWLLVAPFFLAFWANLHGGFPIGLVLVGCYVLAAAWDSWQSDGWAGLRQKRFLAFAACLVACVVATFVNPYGWKVYQYVGLTSSVANSRRIDEWLPPGLDQLVGKVWVLSVLGLLVLLGLTSQRLKTRELVLIMCFLPLACGSARMVSWWLLIVVPIAGRLLAGWLPALKERDAEEKPTVGATLTAALILVVCLVSLPWFADYNPALVLTHRNHRTEADLERIAARLQSQNEGERIFCRFEWGEYMGWALTPGHTVFVDGRIEIFPDDVWSDFTAITRGRGDWQAILDRYKVDCLLLDASGFHGDLFPLVQKSPQWVEVCTAGDAVLFLRRTSGDSMAATAATSPHDSSATKK
jgi:hypothetical protein